MQDSRRRGFGSVVSLLRTAGTIAVAAVVLAATSTIAAGSKPASDKAGVSIVTITGGPVDTTEQHVYVPIPLDGQATFSFTQRAGDVVELVSRVIAEPSPGTNFCDMMAIVYDDSTNVGTRADFSTNKGEYGEGGAFVTGLPAPASDRIVTLAAVASEIADTCDEEVLNDDGSVADSGEDTWTVSVAVSIVTLRN